MGKMKDQEMSQSAMFCLDHHLSPEHEVTMQMQTLISVLLMEGVAPDVVHRIVESQRRQAVYEALGAFEEKWQVEIRINTMVMR